MENISFRILRICIYVYAIELQIAQLLSVPEPCPDITPSATIADMCSSDYANEEPSNGGVTVDSVALRVMTQQDGCACEVSLQNQTKIDTVYMRNYDLRTSAAPEQKVCGLAIDIDYTSPQTFPENKDSIECTKGITTRSVSLSKNGVLNLISRTIGGNFSRGYCIQIYRSHISGDSVSIQINCSLPNMQTTKQDKTVSRNMQTTQQMTDAVIQDRTASDTDSILFIAIGVGSVVVVIALIVVVTIKIIRRKGNRNKDGIEVQPDIDSNDDDSDGLKYNCLYNASEQQDIIEGDYHTVDLKLKQNRTRIHNLGTDYSTVDGNYSSVDMVNMPAKDGSKSDKRTMSSSTIKQRSETPRIEEQTSNNLKHMTAGSNAEYAVVDKSDKSDIMDQNIKHVSAPNDINVEYAVVDKSKA